jgi:cytidylate kinase
MDRYAAEGNAIIIGRGGQMVLRDYPTALHVHLFAPVEVRTRRIMQRFDIAEAEAARRIAASDEEKRLFIRFMHDNVNWKDPKYYHLIINTGAVAPQAAAEMIVLGAQGR